MKPGLLGILLGVALGAAAALGSCTVDRPSETLKCINQNECGSGRICTSGYCVVGTLPVDADLRPPDAAVCPAICQGTCDFQTLTCMITGTGSGNITCPTGWNCDITCASAGACGTIGCTNAASCKIGCTTADACLNINCNGADCVANCTGVNACGSITCTTGDCTATCVGVDACENISCTTGHCTETCSGGADACGILTCGTGECDATCTGPDSACGQVNCATSCQCDVTCDSTTNPCPAVMNCPDPGGPTLCTEGQAVGNRCDSSVATQCQGC